MKFKHAYIYLFLTGILVLGLFACNHKPSKTTDNSEKSKVTKSAGHGYNELANPDHQKSFTISDYNSDDPEITNIERPGESTVNTKLDTTALFGVWTSDPGGPHADFELTSNSFYVVDYDGDGDMPYQLIGNSIKIYYNDFILEGKIISVDNNTLKIMWKGFDTINTYSKWTQ